MRKRRLYTQSVRADIAARRLRNARKTVRGLIRTAGVCLGVVALVFLLSSPRVAVNKVKVEGGSPTVQRWASAKMMSGLGQNMIRARVTSLESAVAAHPWIKTVTVARALPRTLVCTISERSPYTSVRIKESYYIVDMQLVAYRKQGNPTRNRPVLAVANLCPPALGKPWRSSRLNQAVKCLEAAKDRGLAVREVSIDPSGYMCLNIGNGVQVRAGSARDIEKKLYEASKFLTSQAIPLDQVDYVDVSCPSAPAYRPRMATSDSP